MHDRGRTPGGRAAADTARGARGFLACNRASMGASSRGADPRNERGRFPGMEIKGLILQARKDFVVDNFGEKEWDRVLGKLPEEDRAKLGDLILTARWYPFEIGERLDKAIVDLLGGGDQKLFEEIGAKSAKRSLAKVHTSFLTPGDPQAFLEKADVIYKFYYDTGRREYERTGPASGVLTTHEAKTFSVPDCLTVVGWYKEALRMCGARGVEIVEEECRARGGSCCRYRVTWIE